MIRLLYLSQAVVGITDEQIRDILQLARRNNQDLGITGVLVQGGGLFMQVLEGSEQAVLRKYVKIMDDQRHSNCQIIHISHVIDRMFQNWSMGVINSKPLEFQHIAELQAHRLEAIKSKEFSDTMREFLEKLHSGQAPKEDEPSTCAKKTFNSHDAAGISRGYSTTHPVKAE